MKVPRKPMIYGSADGTTTLIGLVAGLVISRQTEGAVWHAALAGGLSGLAGMTLGQYWSTPEDGFMAALVCGLSSMAAIVGPAVPFLFLGRAWAAAVSVAAVLAIAALVCWLRPEHGVRAVAMTYGLLIIAGGMAAVSGLT